jgi:hypothetical protein
VEQFEYESVYHAGIIFYRYYDWYNNYRILGSIATNLTQLRTWDQAIKELVQNADDAEATEITLSVTNTGLLVYNNQYMSYCDRPDENYMSCSFKEKSKNDFCDVHAIKTLSSQNKKRNSKEKINND